MKNANLNALSKSYMKSLFGGKQGNDKVVRKKPQPIENAEYQDGNDLFLRKRPGRAK